MNCSSVFNPKTFYLFTTQNEAKMQTLAENVKEVEAKKRKLEEAVDTLNENLANQTANGMLINQAILRSSCS